MDNTIILKLVRGEEITPKDITNELYEICDREHAGCNWNCPVYEANNGTPPRETEEGKLWWGCDCFKNGKAMMEFILMKDEEKQNEWKKYI